MDRNAHVRFLGEGRRQRRPLTQQAVSYIVSRYLGLENLFARDYLLSYGNTAEDLIANLDQVQQASHWMIERLEQGIQGHRDE